MRVAVSGWGRVAMTVWQLRLGFVESAVLFHSDHFYTSIQCL